MRQNRAKAATRAQLPSQEEARDFAVPELPARADELLWHPLACEWWDGMWKSPMAAEFLDSDKVGMLQVAELYHALGNATSITGRLAVMAEIRHQEARFGASPMDRRRLQWEVDKGEDAAARTAKRRERQARPDPSGDPRGVLKVV